MWRPRRALARRSANRVLTDVAVSQPVTFMTGPEGNASIGYGTSCLPKEYLLGRLG